jgi:hypothetical protein
MRTEICLTPLLSVSTDLLFTAKIRVAAESARREFRNARSLEAFETGLRSAPGLVVVDLTAPHGFASLDLLARATVRPELVVGFYPHVERAIGARAAGYGFVRVLTRSKFVGALEELVRAQAERAADIVVSAEAPTGDDDADDDGAVPGPSTST